MDAQLQQISSKPNSEQPAAYQSLIDATASAQDAAGMRTILERLLSDAVPQAASLILLPTGVKRSVKTNIKMMSPFGKRPCSIESALFPALLAARLCR